MLIKVAIPNQIQLKLVPNFTAFLTGKQNDVHYIGGAEVLPAPLEGRGGGPGHPGAWHGDRQRGPLPSHRA